MSDPRWMIYGANGYSGELIAREARRRGLKPVLAGRSAERIALLAQELNSEHQAFALADASGTVQALAGMALVLNCAGPFSATAAPLATACLKAGAHYLDITGEIEVFEALHARDAEARVASVVLCPGVGFDVIPTDCLAMALKMALPDATHLALGFDSRSGFSPGTAKTMVEGLGQGGRVRRDGRIVAVPPVWKIRRIDFGRGEKTAMTIPWGDVATAFYSTGIPTIETYIPATPTLLRWRWLLPWLRPLFGLGFVQTLLKQRVTATVRGPDVEQLQRTPTWVWGEVTNAAGERKIGRVQTANGYDVTVQGALAVVEWLLVNTPAGGYYTPAQLLVAGLVETLPGSTPVRITAT
ncbi:MAG: saccharopine dehydrogenase family protein [Proteobacteria bacterium]|nr:saccharopine dehydrogenase family protein [Pseudomonadota bacterium]